MALLTAVLTKGNTPLFDLPLVQSFTIFFNTTCLELLKEKLQTLDTRGELFCKFKQNNEVAIYRFS